MHKNEEGFSAIEGLLVLIIVAAIAGAGYFVYRAQKDPKSSQDGPSTSQQENNNDQQSQSKSYVEVKELGVKFEKTTDLSEVYYVMHSDNKTAYFSLESLKDTSCAADKIAQVALTKYTETELAETPGGGEALRPLAKQINSFYYVADTGQAACDTDINGANQQKAGVMAEAVIQSVKNSLVAL